jgi:putative hydrolase of the HAD superfamily
LIDPAAGESVDFARLAVEYEARANPSWPMPGLRECLDALHGKGLLLGLVSNAQFYTPALFEGLLGAPPEAFGFDRDLQYYSYQYGWGKPSPRLFELAAEALAARAVAAGEVVYVGNDMLNDIAPARQVGFRTALFAGDARSLRLRQGDPRVEGVAADVILTELGQIVECILT